MIEPVATPLPRWSIYTAVSVQSAYLQQLPCCTLGVHAMQLPQPVYPASWLNGRSHICTCGRSEISE